MSWEHERAHFRVEYPIRERPTFTAGGVSYLVADCSEQGMRYVETGEMPEMGTRLAGRLRFSRGEELDVEGEVVRFFDRSVGLRLNGAGIPMRTIFDEQRFLRKLYPTRF